MKNDFPAIRDMGSVINIRNIGDCVIGKYTFSECLLSNSHLSFGSLQPVDVGSVASPTFTPVSLLDQKPIYTRTFTHPSNMYIRNVGSTLHVLRGCIPNIDNGPKPKMSETSPHEPNYGVSIAGSPQGTNLAVCAYVGRPWVTGRSLLLDPYAQHSSMQPHS
jgi:hypothetical protein